MVGDALSCLSRTCLKRLLPTTSQVKLAGWFQIDESQLACASCTVSPYYPDSVSVAPLKHVEPVAGFLREAEMLECWHKVVNRVSTVARIDDFLSLLKGLLQYERMVCPLTTTTHAHTCSE